LALFLDATVHTYLFFFTYDKAVKYKIASNLSCFAPKLLKFTKENTPIYDIKEKKSDKVATQLKARGDLIGLGFDWFNFIRD